MKKIVSFILLIVVLIGCQTSKKNDEVVKRVEIDAISLKGNLLNTSLKQNIYVLLPPSYNSSKKRYPVVYYLSGYTQEGFRIRLFESDAKKLMAEKKIKEFIIVGIGGINKHDGSFYTNSPVSGNWEDFIKKDVVNYVDNNYRTIAKAESRGISGYSMGGYGSLAIGMTNTDIYQVLYSQCPGVFEKGALKEVLSSWNDGQKGTWDDRIMESYGTAFAPNVEAGEPYFDAPKFDGTVEDNLVIKKWISGYGDWDLKAKNYANSDKKLKAIRIVYGKNDYFPWIVKGVNYLSTQLNNNNIKHDLIGFSGGHEDIGPNHAKDKMLPFFSENLEFNY